jgi:peptide/nickel transport system ATP-binding protein
MAAPSVALRYVLTVNNLRTSLNANVPIIDGISFAIPIGKTFALLGESGCGKSMTALSLLRLLPDGIGHVGGTITLDGLVLNALTERDMQAVRGGILAMIFQEPGLSLNPVMTVGQQIAEVIQMHDPSVHNVAQRCVELLTQVGINDAAQRVNQYPFQFSGGMKQRVMIAMALAGKPKLLIADEPTTALDVTIQAQVLQLLRDTQANTGMAMLLITHDLGVVSENAHQVGVMYAGEIVEHASRDALFARPLHPYTQQLFAALPDGKRGELSAIKGSVPPLGSIQVGCRFAPRCEQVFTPCHTHTPVLSELSEGSSVRCHLYDERLARPSALLVAKSHHSVPIALGYAPPTSRPPLLTVADLQVHFPVRKGLFQGVVGQVRAVDGVSFELAVGRTLAIVGESGCGKTTLAKSLLQLIKPTAGSVQFAGEELVGLTSTALREKRAAMQMVFQDPYASLNPKLRVAEILEEGMIAQGIAENSAARQLQIDKFLDLCGLPHAAKWRYPHEFSGGQRQRIAIARALAVSPKLLICDEPTSALDVSVQAQILNLLKSLQAELGLSYLFITHNLAVVDYLADEVCVMLKGGIVERGSVARVLDNPQHHYTKKLLAAMPKINHASR